MDRFDIAQKRQSKLFVFCGCPLSCWTDEPLSLDSLLGNFKFTKHHFITIYVATHLILYYIVERLFSGHCKEGHIVALIDTPADVF